MIKKPKTLDPIRTNAGIKAWYEKELKKLVSEMNTSVKYWLMAEFKKQEDKIAFDASPSKDLTEKLDDLFKKQSERFKAISRKLATQATMKNSFYVKNKLTSQIKSAISKELGVKLTMTRNVEQVVKTSIQESVDLIKSIPVNYFQRLRFGVMEAVRQGKDQAGLFDFIQETYRITNNRASLIARDQIKKSGSAITRARYNDLGINKAIWIHPKGISNEPRLSHLKADGKTFNINKGCLIDGEYIFPKQKINCNCDYAPVIDELGD